MNTDKVKLQVKASLHEDASLVYGDIDFNSFVHILIRASPQPGDVFVDLGSGTSRAVVVTALLYGDGILSKCHGIEILQLLHDYGEMAISRLKMHLEENSLLSHHRVNYSIEHNDFLSTSCFDWTIADIVFLNSTCFSDTLMHHIQDKAESMKRGAKIISLTKHFSSSQLKIVESVNLTMSWGLATCYFHVKL
jgi:hypothetical protein